MALVPSFKSYSVQFDVHLVNIPIYALGCDYLLIKSPCSTTHEAHIKL